MKGVGVCRVTWHPSCFSRKLNPNITIHFMTRSTTQSTCAKAVAIECQCYYKKEELVRHSMVVVDLDKIKLKDNPLK